MKYIIVFVTALLFSVPCFSQKRTLSRSDTVGISIPFRYLVLSAAAGIEIPVRNHAYAALINRNDLPYPSGFREINSLALEYRRYFSTHNPAAQDFLGAYLLLLRTDYPSRQGSKKTNKYWTESQSANIGFLSGWKIYARNWAYLELFSGAHMGYQKGTRSWDEHNTITGEINRHTEEAERLNIGFRLGLNAGFQF
jgi:hypothetical protein